MLTWAQKRQLAYGSVAAAVLLLFIGVGYFIFFTEEPSCSDGEKNGTEVGVDCGGVCQRMCATQVRSLTTLWTRAFRVTDGVYNAVAYIENPNPDAEAHNVGYRMTFYNSAGEQLAQRTGTTSVPVRKRIGVFEGSIAVDAPIARSTFEVTDGPEWYRHERPLQQIGVQSKALTDEERRPRVEATLVNRSLDTVHNLDVVGIIYDDLGNAISASQTFVPRLDGEESTQIVFSWPEPFDLAEDTCQVPVDTSLVIDRSGSMDDDGSNPPQPLTDVKDAAKTFVNKLSDDDQVSVVSFATQASNPVDQELTYDKSRAREAVESVRIHDDGTQHTNIADGVRAAHSALAQGRGTSTARQVMIVLTDGVATHPTSPTSGDNTAYAETQAIQRAQRAAKAGLQIYTIGLGEKVNPSFLRKVATSPNHYFQAPDAQRLATIYSDIASSICKLGPKVVEIIPQPSLRRP